MSDATTSGSTVICTDCGSVNEDGATFCGGCGSYLEWDGERVGPAEPEPEVEPEAPPETSRPTLVDRVKAGLGIDPEATPPPADEAHDGTRSEGAAAPADPAASPRDVLGAGGAKPGLPALDDASVTPKVATRTPVGQEDSGARRPAAPVRPAPAKPAPAQPVAAHQPAAVKPGAEATLSGRKNAAPVDEHRPRPGETVCGQCGAGNAPERKFCRRCGKDLAGAAVVPPPPWWRRLFQRRRTTVTAGTRPVLTHRSRVPRRLVTLLVLVGVVYGLVRVAGPWVGGPVEAVRDRISDTQPHEPTLVVASSTARGRGAALARDGNTETSWAPAAPGDGIGQYLQATFDEPFRLVAVQIFNGSTRDQAKYLLTRRPTKVTLSITNADGKVVTREEDLRDDPEVQNIRIGVDDVTAVRLTIKRAVGTAPGSRVTLGEMAFFTRS